MTGNTDSTVSIYFNEVGGYHLPKPAEELALFTSYKRAQTQAEIGPSATLRAQGARDAAEIGKTIACGYLRFVILQARRKTSDPQLLKDLISQGNIGLMVSIPRFEPELGNRFLTYAANWINVFMQEHLHKLSTVHVPSHTRKEVRKQRKLNAASGAADDAGLGAFLEPATTSIDNVNIAIDGDLEAESGESEYDPFAFMEMAELTRVERLVVTYTYGLRGTELSAEEIQQFFYELDGSIISEATIKRLAGVGMGKLRALMVEKGISATRDVL